MGSKRADWPRQGFTSYAENDYPHTNSILVWKCIDNKSLTIGHYGKRTVEFAVVLDAPVHAS